MSVQARLQHRLAVSLVLLLLLVYFILLLLPTHLLTHSLTHWLHWTRPETTRQKKHGWLPDVQPRGPGLPGAAEWTVQEQLLWRAHHARVSGAAALLRPAAPGGGGGAGARGGGGADPHLREGTLHPLTHSFTHSFTLRVSLYMYHSATLSLPCVMWDMKTVMWCVMSCRVYSSLVWHDLIRVRCLWCLCCLCVQLLRRAAQKNWDIAKLEGVLASSDIDPTNSRILLQFWSNEREKVRQAFL